MMRSAVEWITRILSWLVILTVGLLLLVCVAIPRVTGATPYTVLTGSMRPDLPPGTLVVVKPVDASEISIGTVVTYQLESGKPAVVTHRVVGVGADGKGENVFITQGDANNTPDAKQVAEEQIRGRLWYSIPYVGRVNDLISGRERQIGMIAVVSGLLIYAAYQLVSSRTDRRREQRGGSRRAERT